MLMDRLASHEGLSPLELARQYFPDREDWIALQGGKPRVFRKPKNPLAAWLVVHVYEEHADVSQRFRSGIIVPTMPPEGKIMTSRFHVKRSTTDGMSVERDIVIPSFMHRTVHGDACAERSMSLKSGASYDSVRNQEEYESILSRLDGEDYQELRFGLNVNGFALIPLPAIRPATPLGESR